MLENSFRLMGLVSINNSASENPPWIKEDGGYGNGLDDPVEGMGERKCFLKKFQVKIEEACGKGITWGQSEEFVFPDVFRSRLMLKLKIDFMEKIKMKSDWIINIYCRPSLNFCEFLPPFCEFSQLTLT